MFQYQLFCGHGYPEYTTIVRAEAVTKSGNPGITQIFNCNLNFLHKNKMPLEGIWHSEKSCAHASHTHLPSKEE